MKNMDLLLSRSVQKHLFLAGGYLVLAACALFVIASTCSVLISMHWHGPFRDMWEIFSFLEKIVNRNWVFADLWGAYGNSHRLLIPKLLFVIDYQLFAANNHFLIFISVICQIIICGIFLTLLWRDKTIKRFEAFFLITAVACFQFSAGLLFNFMHTFDVQWFLTCSFVVTSFFLIAASGNNNSFQFRAVFSGILIFLACLNNFSGMAAWPVWLLMVFLGHLTTKQKTILTIFSLVAIFVLSYGISSSDFNVTGWKDFLKFVFYILVWFPVHYLGNPLSDKDYFPFSDLVLLIVFLSIVFVLHFWWRLLFSSKNKKNVAELFFSCVSLFGFGVALITAIGRGYDPDHVHALRYQNIVMLYWSAIVCLVFLETKKLSIGLIKYLSRVLAVGFLIGILYCQKALLIENHWLGYQVNRAHLALMMGFSNNVPMIAATVSRSMIYVPGYNLEAERQLHEAAKVGIYSGELADNWLHGVELDKITNSCVGLSWSVSDLITPYTRYFDFTVHTTKRDYSRAMLVDKSGKVAAVAIPEVKKSHYASWSLPWSSMFSGLKGFSLTDGADLVLVAVSSSGQACKEN